MTTTQFVWRDALGMGAFEPPEPASAKHNRYGPDSVCWLCGGVTDGVGWHMKDVIGSAFTDSNLAAAVNSATVCQSCAALMKKESWRPACEKFGHSPHFPAKGGKEPFLSNWMFSSHVFSAGEWVRPDRAVARAVLLRPPPPPFVITLAEAGKKHVIFRARVNHDVDNFFVQLDEQTIQVDRNLFASALEIFEEGYEAGFSKDSLLTGAYNQAAVLKAGLAMWRKVEDALRGYRHNHPEILKLCHFCGQKSE